MIFGKKKENESLSGDWQLYEKGKEYHRSLGLYEKTSVNERFYRGDQWQGITTNGLPSPVFNVFKRVVDYYVSNIMSDSAVMRYSFEAPMEFGGADKSEVISEAEKLCNAVADRRWEKDKINSLVADALRDAALSGDGVAYVYWDNEAVTGQPFSGDFRTVLLDNTNVFFGNPNVKDVQKQPYILISGRETVEEVRRAAKHSGADEHTLKQIVTDREVDGQSGEFGSLEIEETKCVTLIKLWRGENGNIFFRKSVKGAVVIPDTDLGIGLYPLCFFNWTKIKNCWHGESAATGLAENQVFINKGYAMMMKHMMDTAFSKVVYDATVIDEWTNRVGEAIAVNGSVDNVARVLTGGSMQAGMLDVVNLAISHTKEFLGATDTALGNIDPRNTSAIIAVQQASAMPLQNIRRQLHQFIEDLGLIWLEFMIAYYDEFRMVPTGEGNWTNFSVKGKVSGMIRSCRVDVGASTQWSEISALNTLDNLLSGGHITLKQYLERIPDGIVPKKTELIEEINVGGLT